MYTPCSVAGRVSATGPQLVVMAGRDGSILFVHMVVAGLQLVMVGENKVAVYMVVVVTMLVYPEQLVHPCGRVVVVSIATDPQLVGEQVLVMYMVVVIAGLGERSLSDLLALVGVGKKVLIAAVLAMVSSMLQLLMMVLVMLMVLVTVLVVLVHVPM